MSEDQQKNCLEVDGVLERPTAETISTCLPSLADVAFKMRDEIIKAGCDWFEAVCEVIYYCEGQKYCKECGRKHKTKKSFNWHDDAQPIHWIIAVLIAKIMKYQEEEN